MQPDQELLVVTEDEAGLRLDSYLSQKFPEYSRTYFQSLIDEKLVLVNGELIKKGRKLEVGDEIEVEFAVTSAITIEPEDIPLNILYEDAHLLAINKPAGMVVHPAVGNWSGTFVNALIFHCKQLNAQESLRPGIVHRLDKETSGLLLAAKDEATQRKLVEMFALRQVEKEYLAICVGNPGRREINAPISRHPIRRKEMAVNLEKGKEAKTRCETIAYTNHLSVVRLLPHTGRTHQLRVHMQHLGFPILGDTVYGSVAANKKFGAHRQLLHALRLKFIHPITKEEIELKAPLPQDIIQFVDKIGPQCVF